MLKGDHQVADETHFCSEKRIPAQKQTRKPCITAKPMEGRGDESKMGTATEQQPPPTANESTAPRESAVRAERRGGPRTAPAPSAARGMTAFRPPGEPQRSAAQPRAAPTPPPRAPERRNARIAAPLWGFSLELTPYGRTDAPRCAPGAEGERGGGAHRPHRPRPLRPPRATLRLRAPRPAPPPLPSPRGIEAALPTPPPRGRSPSYPLFPIPVPRTPRRAPSPLPDSGGAAGAVSPHRGRPPQPGAAEPPDTALPPDMSPTYPSPRHTHTPRTCRRPSRTHTHARGALPLSTAPLRARARRGGAARRGGGLGGGLGGAALRLLPRSGGGSAPTSPPRALTPSLRSAPPPRGRARAGPRGGRREKAGGAALAPRAEGEGNGGRAPGLPPSLRPCDARGGEAGGADGYS